MKIHVIFFLFFFNIGLFSQENTYLTQENISYTSRSTNNIYKTKMCMLDIYYPSNIDNFTTIIWIHGGGLSGGNKNIPKEFKEQGIGIVAINYRLYPKVKAPSYIEDVAEATAWVFNHIEEYGGNASKIFISGHSAGGYLTSMIGLDKSWLAAYNIDADSIAGLMPLSGHMITHFTVRDEKNIPRTQPIIDELAPLFHVRRNTPPILLITGDREKEMLGRYEENAYMMRMLKVIGNKNVKLYELDGYGHNITIPAIPLIINEIKALTNKKKQ